jgi:predicted enzyme related to lactoylglutathione lyase
VAVQVGGGSSASAGSAGSRNCYSRYCRVDSVSVAARDAGAGGGKLLAGHRIALQQCSGNGGGAAML